MYWYLSVYSHQCYRRCTVHSAHSNKVCVLVCTYCVYVLLYVPSNVVSNDPPSQSTSHASNSIDGHGNVHFNIGEVYV